MIGLEGIIMDIAGTCNAKCPYCMTGPGKIRRNSFMSPERMQAALAALKRQGVINEGTVLSLFNWGEPFLHRGIGEIIEVLNNEGIGFVLSTNAQVFREMTEPMVRNLRQFQFSVSGFSEASYARIHGFRFDHIRENIVRFVASMRNHGYHGLITINFHVYQFNIMEIEAAKKFARDLNISLVPYFAFMNEWDSMKAYVVGQLSYETLQNYAKSLFLCDIDQLLHSSPDNYRCPQWKYLTLDEDCNALTCCQTPKYNKEFVLGSILEESVEDILARRPSSAICEECIRTGLAYYIHNAMQTVNITPPVNQRVGEASMPQPTTLRAGRVGLWKRLFIRQKASPVVE